MPDNTLSTLQVIQQKVRRLTRSPSLSQLSDTDLNNYINTFFLYDFPEHLRLFSLRTTLTFYTQPHVDRYTTDTTDPNDPLYNFCNKYIAVHPPLFLAGVPGFYTQERDVFYGMWPQYDTIARTQLYGNGTTGPFSGPTYPTIVAAPMIQNQVLFTCLDQNGNSMILVDYPQGNVLGALGLPNAPQTLPSPYGQINYITGVFSGVTFPNPTAVRAPIYLTNVAYQPGKPIGMLYYDNIFTIRPIPDKTYTVQIEADIRPTELLATTQIPQIAQWAQWIAYGAAKKVFEDRMDMDSVQMIMPEYRKQEVLVLRTTLTQQANERTTTIYTQGKNFSFGWGFGGGGWPY